MVGLPDADKSLKLQPNDVFGLNTRGSIFEALGRKDEVAADFEKALSKYPGNQDCKDALKRDDFIHAKPPGRTPLAF